MAVPQEVFLRVAGRTEIGPTRATNEDAYHFFGPHNLLVVCDGMGGNSSGRPAAKIAIWAIHERFERGEPGGWKPTTAALAAKLRGAVESVHQRIHRIRRQLPGVAATLAALHLGPSEGGNGPALTIAHIGNTRVYRFADGILSQLTHDHSVLAVAREQGVTIPPAQAKAYARMTTRALGERDELSEVDVHTLSPQIGERFLVTTDGLDRFVDDTAIISALNAHPNDLQAGIDALFKQALTSRCDDNLTACLAEVVTGPGPSPSHGSTHKPTLPWLYATHEELAEIPSRLSGGPSIASYREMYALIMGEDG